MWFHLFIYFSVFYYILMFECLINIEIFKVFHMGVCWSLRWCERGWCLSLMTVRLSAQVSCLNLGVSRAVWNFFGPCVWLCKYLMLHVLPDVTFLILLSPRNLWAQQATFNTFNMDEQGGEQLDLPIPTFPDFFFFQMFWLWFLKIKSWKPGEGERWSAWWTGRQSVTVLVTQLTRLRKEKCFHLLRWSGVKMSEDEWTDYKGKVLVFRFTWFIVTVRRIRSS